MKVESNVQNLNYCDFAKTILMLLVVLCHSAAFWGGNWFTACKPLQTDSTLGMLSSWLGTFHVSGFTLISGYIYYFVKNERGKYNKFLDIILNKAKRLLVPYIAVSILWVIPISNIFYDFNFNDIFHKFILGEAPLQLWFLLMLFNVFVIAHLSFVRIRRLEFFVVCIFVLGTLLPMIFPNVFQIFTSMQYLLFFFIGYLIRKKGINLNSPTTLIYGSVLLLLNLFCFAMIEYYNFEDSIIAKILHLIVNTIGRISGAIMAFLLLSYIASKISQTNVVFKFISNLNFLIYLFHQQIIYVLLWWFSLKVSPWPMTFINLVCSLLFSCLIGYILTLNKYSRYIIGIK